MNTNRLMMISQMEAANASAVADLFREHDKTGVPQKIGLTGRSLFHYQGITMHMIESEENILDRILEAHSDPEFQTVNEGLRPYLSPLVSEWKDITDSQATEFYRANWSG